VNVTSGSIRKEVVIVDFKILSPKIFRTVRNFRIAGIGIECRTCDHQECYSLLCGVSGMHIGKEAESIF
jgi:hypothetical protein